MWQYACCLLRISLIPSSQFSIMEHPIIIAPAQQVFSPHKSRRVAAVPLSKVDPGINYKSEGLCGRETFQKIIFKPPGGPHIPLRCSLHGYISLHCFSFLQFSHRSYSSPAAGLRPLFAPAQQLYSSCFGIFRTLAFLSERSLCLKPYIYCIFTNITGIRFVFGLPHFTTFVTIHPCNTSIFEYPLRTFFPSYPFTILYFSGYSSVLECCTYLSVS